MADSRNNPPVFGIGLSPTANVWQQIFSQTLYAEEAGLDFVSIQDHPYVPEFLDTWTLLAALGGVTSRVGLLTNVLNLPLRPPAMLAKAAGTLDIITGGRIYLGLGAGSYWDGVAAFGGPRREPGEAVEATAEAIQVMRALWDGAPGSTVNFSGKYYRLEDAQPGPAPAHRIPIWIGAVKPRMLRLTGAMADGLIVSSPYIPPERVMEVQALIDEGAASANRGPLEIRRGYNVVGKILPEASVGKVTSRRPGVILGTSAQWAEQLVRFYRELRLDAFSFGFGATGEEGDNQLRRYAEEVVPSVREMLGRG